MSILIVHSLSLLSGLDLNDTYGSSHPFRLCHWFGLGSSLYKKFGERIQGIR